jgi:peptide/nickel transport system ATP-binding protein
VVALQNLTVTYAGHPSAVEHFSLAVAPGERVGLAGQSGCGKTTILRTIVGLLPASARVAGRSEIAGRIGYIPQEGLDSLSPFLTAGDQVSELAPSRAEAAELLNRVRLGHPRISAAYPHQLSGGERQRVLVAQALALRPQLIVADEPTAQLDPDNETTILGILDAYARETGAAILIASHRERVFQVLGCRIHRMTPDLACPVDRAGQPSEGAPLLSIRSLTKTYYRRDWLTRPQPVVRALDQLSFEISAGEFVALGGASGAGKSTLARCIAGREAWESGSLEWRAAANVPASDRVQLVQQEPSESLNPRLSIAEALQEAGAPGDPELLAQAGLPKEWMRRKVSALSEGQRARVAILRSASRLKHGLLILDESLSGLDPATRASILNYICGLQKERGLSVLWITHDLEAAAQLGARTVRMSAGRIAA